MEPCTRTGASPRLVVPSPSRPSPLFPQHQAAPAEVRAQVCSPPAETLANELHPVWKVATGTVVADAVLSPSWPTLLRPQHQGWPPEVSPQACVPPASIWTKALVGVTVASGPCGVRTTPDGSEQAESRAAASSASGARRRMVRGFMGRLGERVGESSQDPRLDLYVASATVPGQQK